MPELDKTVRRGGAPVFIWWALVAGPLAWTFDLGLSYALTQHSCSTGHYYLLHVITVVCAGIALSGLACAWSAHTSLPPEATEQGRRPLDRTYFQVLFGLVFSLAFVVAIIAEAVPRWILSPCD